MRRGSRRFATAISSARKIFARGCSISRRATRRQCIFIKTRSHSWLSKGQCSVKDPKGGGANFQKERHPFIGAPRILSVDQQGTRAISNVWQSLRTLWHRHYPRGGNKIVHSNLIYKSRSNSCQSSNIWPFAPKDTGKLASFYMDVFEMQILHKDKKESGVIYLTDGYFNLAILPNHEQNSPNGLYHFGFRLRTARRSSSG